MVGKSSSIDEKNMITLCKKNDITNTIDKYLPSTNWYCVSISQDDKNEKERDEYIILLVATNEYDKDKNNVGNIIDKSYIKTMKSYLSTNMSCNNGSKHNGTYGKYYGIGLINKYHLKDGLSFGHFKNKQKNKVSDDSKRIFLDNVRKDFDYFVMRLNRALPGIVDAGNTLINSMITGEKKDPRTNIFTPSQMKKI